MANGKEWTAKDRDRLRNRQPGETIAMLAEELGRSIRAIERAVVRFDVKRRKGWRLLADREEEYRELNAEGFSDYAVAKKLGISPATVFEFRKKLGLPDAEGRRTAPYLESRKEAYKKTVRTLEVERLADTQPIAMQCKAAARGWWPHAVSGEEADVLDELTSGDKTLRDLGERLKLKWPAQRLKGLKKRGVIVRRRVGSEALFSLAAGVHRRKPKEDGSRSIPLGKKLWCKGG